MKSTAKKIYKLVKHEGKLIIVSNPVISHRPLIKPGRKTISNFLENEKIRNAVQLDSIYHNYFHQNNCKQLFNILNKHSRIDGVLTSGSSNIIIEYKRRYCTSYEYYTAIIERKKHKALIECKVLFDAPAAFYICEYSDGIICIWLIDSNTHVNWENQICQKEDGSSDKEEKETGYLLFDDADIIISKKTWNRIPFPVLQDYFRSKRNEG